LTTTGPYFDKLVKQISETLLSLKFVNVADKPNSQSLVFVLFS